MSSARSPDRVMPGSETWKSGIAGPSPFTGGARLTGTKGTRMPPPRVTRPPVVGSHASVHCVMLVPVVKPVTSADMVHSPASKPAISNGVTGPSGPRQGECTVVVCAGAGSDGKRGHQGD